MGVLAHLCHAVRMTDGVFWPVRTGRKAKKTRFFSDNGGSRRAKVAASSHHTDRATVHGRVEEADTKGSTWISKDARWIVGAQRICRQASARRPEEKELVMEGPRLGKATVNMQWRSPGWTSRSRGCLRNETSWMREGVWRRPMNNILYYKRPTNVMLYVSKPEILNPKP